MKTKNAFNPVCAAMRHGEVYTAILIARLYGVGMTMEWGSSIVQNNATLFPYNVPIFQNNDAIKQIEEWFHKHQDEVKFIPWSSDLHVLKPSLGRSGFQNEKSINTLPSLKKVSKNEK